MPFPKSPAVALAALSLLAAAPAHAIDPSELLAPEEAFALRVEATARDRIELRWTIADGYYLYRHRFDVQPDAPSLRFAPLALPAGKRHRDEFFGEVETYHDAVVGTLDRVDAGGGDSVRLRVKSQGCADAGFCYPPQIQRITVALPADDSVGAASSLLKAAAIHGRSPRAAATALEPSGGGLGGAGVAPVAAKAALAEGGGIGLTSGPRKPLFGEAAGAIDDLPLPPEQAFRFEAIADSPTALLLRLTPTPGYYLYRDRSSFRIADGDGIALGAPQWPRGTHHVDEHFGEVVVYFKPVEVPLPLRREAGDARTIALETTFQGCQTDGICYPPMTRRVEIPLPQATAQMLALAEQAAGDARTQSPNPVNAHAFGAWSPVRLGLLLAGAALIGVALWLRTRPRAGRPLGWLLLAIGAALLLWALVGGPDERPADREPGEQASPGFHEIASVADLDAALAQADLAGRAVLLDFYADWCAPCLQMEKRTFPAPAVRKALADFVLLKVDVTANDADDQALMRRYGIVGPPATLFFGKGAREHGALRLRGFEPPEAFAARLAKAAGATRR